MQDFFISYSSSERSRALVVATALHRLGRTVWIDDGATTDDGVDQFTGIPVGQSHWALIQTAIDQSYTFLVLDSPSFRASAYCQQELAHAHAAGKRVAVTVLPRAPLPPTGEAFARTSDDDLARLVEDLRQGDEVARAHARLTAELIGAGGRSMRHRLLGHTREQALDAEVVTTSDLASHGLRADRRLMTHCQGLLLAARAAVATRYAPARRPDWRLY